MKKLILIAVALTIPLFGSDLYSRSVKVCQFSDSTNPNIKGWCNGERLSLAELYNDGWIADSSVWANGRMIVILHKTTIKGMKENKE